MPSHELLISEIPLYAKNSDNGKLFVLKDVSEIHRLEESVRRRLYQEQNIARYDFSHIVGKSPALQKYYHSHKNGKIRFHSIYSR